MFQFKCLPCVIEHKLAEQSVNNGSSNSTADHGSVPDLPVIRDAITILNGQPHCYEHIAVQRQSPLAMPGQGPSMS